MFPFCPEEMLKDTPKPVHVPERVLWEWLIHTYTKTDGVIKEPSLPVTQKSFHVCFMLWSGGSCPSNIHMLKPNHQCDCFRTVGRWLGHEGPLPSKIKAPKNCLAWCENTVKSHILQTRRWTPTRLWLLATWPWISRLQNFEK
jgi:hypothetical protein